MPSFRDFYFDSSTGHNKLRAHMCTPDMQPKAVVQIVHGIAEHMDRYDDFMLFLASNGFLVVGDDHLGHGKSIDKPEDIGFFAERNGWTYAVQDEEILRSAMKINYPDIPIIACISRLVGHKGFSLVTDVLHEIMGMDVQMVVLGTGDWQYEEAFRHAQSQYPGRFAAQLTYSAPLSTMIYAGADIFLMPSISFRICSLVGCGYRFSSAMPERSIPGVQ